MPNNNNIAYYKPELPCEETSDLKTAFVNERKPLTFAQVISPGRAPPLSQNSFIDRTSSIVQQLSIQGNSSNLNSQGL